MRSAGRSYEPLIGRERELAAIEELLAAGRSRLVVLEGEAGIGKTALWREALARASAGDWLVLPAQPVEAEATLPFAAATDLLHPVEDEIGSLPAPQRHALRVALVLEEAEGPALDPRAVAVAALELLRRLGEKRPVLLAVDDLHWLDPSSREVLMFALRRLESARVSLLGAWRPQGRLPLAGIEIIRVERLSLPELDLLLRARLELELPRPSLARLEQTSGGNPFYALEIGRLMLRQGFTRLDDSVPIPGGLRGVVQQRLVALSPAAERAALATALLARPTRGLIERATPPAAWREALAAGVIERRGGLLVFTHPLFASVVIADANEDDVHHLHRRLAELVADRQERARHLALAASGPDEGVAAALEHAAVEARRRGAILDAADLSERAFALTPPSHRAHRRHRALLAAGHQFEAGDAHRAAATLEPLVAEAPAGEERATVLLGLAKARGEADDVLAAIDLLQAGLAEKNVSEGLAARLLLLRAGYLCMLGRWVEAIEDAKPAAGKARAVGDLGTLAQALALGAYAAFWGASADDDAAFAEAVELERAGAEVSRDWSPRLIYAVRLSLTSRGEEAVRLLEEVVAETRSTSDASLAAVLGTLADVTHYRGDLDRAEAYARESIETAERDGRKAVAASSLYVLATVASIRGDAEGTRRLVTEGVERLEATGQARHVYAITTSLADLEMSLGRYTEALEALEPSLDAWRRNPGMTPGIFRGVPLAAHILIALGRVRNAREIAEGWIDAALANPTPDTPPLAHWTKGVLAAAEGDNEAAFAEVSAALEAARITGVPYWQARILLTNGTLLRRRRRRNEARKALEEALAIFESLGATVWAANTRSELARLGGRARTSGLSPTEQRIATLVSHGKSNQQVADELWVSRKTVEWNLSKIYRKLHVRSRTELAAKLSRGSGESP